MRQYELPERKEATTMTFSNIGKPKYAETKRQIQRARNEGRLVLFIGAGASVDSGMPLWSKAVEQIAERLGISPKDPQYDMLKIPQYYYNARGKKEYTQLMRELFRYYDKLPTKQIHHRIMSFDVPVIITTNYDHLIEQAAEENGQFFQVVSQDNDLPYTKSGKVLVKMHGDFEHDNFVLKEDDYQHYHSHFKLIENYIKSLIGTKTVLFIGYSLNDPDVKHIFSWVKETLRDDFQFAYLINANDEYNSYQSEYYKNIGVQLIYAKELCAPNDQLNISVQLLETLDYLLSTDNIIDETSLDVTLYNNLQQYSPLHYIYQRYIVNAIDNRASRNHSGLYIDLDQYVCSGNASSKEENELLTGLVDANHHVCKNEKQKIIYDILQKSIIRGIRYKTKKDNAAKEDFTKSSKSEYEIAIHNFDYPKLQMLKEKNSRLLTDSNPELYMQQAAICCALHDYLTAYSCLKNASVAFYRIKAYMWYFIAQYNMRNIGKIISQNLYLDITAEERLLVSKEIQSIDLEKSLSSIPDASGVSKPFLNDLAHNKLSSDMFYSAFQYSQKSSIESKKTYILYAGMPAYERFRQQLEEYDTFCLKNHLFIDQFRENTDIYRLYIRSLLSSLSAPDKGAKNSDFPLVHSTNIHAQQIEKMDIYFMLRYMSTSELLDIFEEYQIVSLEASDEAKDYLKQLLLNLTSAITSKQNVLQHTFFSFIEIWSHTEFNCDDAITCLHLIQNIDNSRVLMDYKKQLGHIAQAMYKQEIFKSGNFCLAAQQTVSNLILRMFEDNDLFTMLRNTIISLVNCCYQGNMQYDDISVINQLLASSMDNYVLELYPALSDNAKATIKEHFLHWSYSKEKHESSTYAQLVLLEIIQPNAETEAEALLALKNVLPHKDKKGVHIMSGGDLPNLFVNMYFAHLIIDKSAFEEIIRQSDDKLSKWLIDMEHFDYADFDLIWLTYCRETKLAEIASTPTIAEKIKEVFMSEYSRGSVDKRIVDIMIQSFLK